MMKIFVIAALTLASASVFASGFKEFKHGMTKEAVLERTTGRDCETSSVCLLHKPKVEQTLFGFPVSDMTMYFDGESLDSKLIEISVSVDKSQREFNQVAVRALGKPMEFKSRSLVGSNLVVYVWKMKDGSFTSTTWDENHIDGVPSRTITGGARLFKSASLRYSNQERGLQRLKSLSKEAGKENTKDF